MLAQIEEILDRGEYRRYGIRIERKAKVGDILPNSWHNAYECDWVEEDTELDGTCVFFLQHADMDSFDSAIGYAASYWPGEQRIVLVGSDSIGTTDVPEDGALCLRHPVVLAVWKQTLMPLSVSPACDECGHEQLPPVNDPDKQAENEAEKYQSEAESVNGPLGRCVW